MKKTFSLSLCTLVLAGTLHAKEQPGAVFLTMSVGARSLGLANTSTAVAQDPSALYWNPAGLARLKTRQVQMAYTSSFSDVRHQFAGYGAPTRKGAWGLAGVFLTQSALEGRDNVGQRTGNFNAQDSAVTFSVARHLSPHFQSGGSVKYIHQSIGADRAHGFAFEGGVSYQSPLPGLELGLAARNVGPGLSFGDKKSPLPTSFNFGAAQSLHEWGLISTDIEWSPVSHSSLWKTGVEWTPLSRVALRTGYASLLAGESISSSTPSSGFGWGLGLRRDRYRVDYAFSPVGDLGNTQNLTLTIDF